MRFKIIVVEPDLSEGEAHEFERRADLLLSEVRAHRLAEVRKRRQMTQAAVAKVLGVTQGRVSAMEKGAINRSEVETLAAYVAALGGQLKLVADFGDETLVLGRPELSPLTASPPPSPPRWR